MHNMKDENRIMPGGELNITPGALAAHPEQKPSTSPAAQEEGMFGEKYAFAERLVAFLKTPFYPKDLKDYLGRRQNLDSKIPDLVSRIGSPAMETKVSMLGTRAWGFTSLGYRKIDVTATSTEHKQILEAELGITEKVSNNEFGTFLKAMLGEELYNHFLSTDLAAAFGVNDPAQEITLNDPAIYEYFPDLQRLSSAHGSYLLPYDPYLFLLGLKPQHRRLLSAAFDRAVQEKEFPFTQGAKTYSTKGEISGYITTKESVEDLFNRGLVETRTLLAAAKQAGITAIKPCLDDIAEFRQKIKAIQTIH